MKKQMKYANDKKIPFVVMIGGNEMEKGILSVSPSRPDGPLAGGAQSWIDAIGE